jgi:hypothetical protein
MGLTVSAWCAAHSWSMRTQRALRTTPVLAAGLALVLAACGQAAPSVTPAATAEPTAASTPSAAPPATRAPTPDPAQGVGRRTAYIDAICPLFLDILELDPRLAALRSEGADGGDVPAQVDEIGAVEAELRTVINELDDVPDWAPGRLLRWELSGALHEIRSALLRVARDVEARDAATQLADVPYISRPTLDSGMQQAANAGLSCDGF